MTRGFAVVQTLLVIASAIACGWYATTKSMHFPLALREQFWVCETGYTLPQPSLDAFWDSEYSSALRAAREPSLYLASLDAEADRAIRNYLVLHPGCTSRPAPRVGNALSGTITCPLDPRMAVGTVTITYEGAVAADGVEATSRMVFDFQPVPGALGPDEERQVAMATKAVEQVGIKLKAERTGECV